MRERSKESKPMGRPPKAEAERYEKHAVSFPPDLWRRLADRVPQRERSPFIQRAVERALSELEGGA